MSFLFVQPVYLSWFTWKAAPRHHYYKWQLTNMLVFGSLSLYQAQISPRKSQTCREAGAESQQALIKGGWVAKGYRIEPGNQFGGPAFLFVYLLLT